MTYTRTVLQSLEVIAVGNDVRPDPDADPVVDADGAAADATVQTEGEGGETPGNSTVFTLEVDTETAERLVFALQAGQVYFTLQAEEFEEVDSVGVTIENLFESDLIEDIFGS